MASCTALAQKTHNPQAGPSTLAGEIHVPGVGSAKLDR